MMTPTIFVVAIVAVGLVAIVVSAIRREREFAKKFPPISDAEFLARCTPGTNPEVALKVRRIVAKSLNIDYERIYPSSRFVGDLGAD
jgi:hypothetical protein